MRSVKIFNKFRSTFAIVWSLFLILLSVYSVLIVRKEIQIETNILNMLPDSDPQTAFVNQAYSKYLEKLSKKIIFVITHTDNDSAVQLASSVSTLVNTSINLFSTIKETEWYNFYFDSRYALLTPEIRDVLIHEKSFFSEFKKYQYGKIMSPVSNFYGNMLNRDPLMIFPDLVSSFTSGYDDLDYHEGKIIFESPESTVVLVPAQINGNSFEEVTQEKFREFLEQNSQVFSKNADHIQYTGVIAYAQEYLERAKFESKLIGILSTIAVLILLISVFRHFKPMLFGVLPIVCGLLFGLTASFLVFEKIHIVSVTMGICLIGICVDYSFHYLSEFSFSTKERWNCTDGLFRILPGITLGAFTSIIGYAVFFFVPFEGLKQTALFTISGLIGAYLTVILLFPALFTKRNKPVITVYLLFKKWTLSYLRLFNSRTFKVIFTVFSVLVLIFGLSRISFLDNLQIFEMKTEEQDKVQEKVLSVMGNNAGSKQILIRAGSTDELLDAVEGVEKKLSHLKNTGEISDYQTITKYVPSLKTQKENIRLLQNRFNGHKDSLEHFFSQIGFEQVYIDSLFNQINDFDEFITLENWAESSVSDQFSQLWVGDLDNFKYSVAEITLKSDHEPLRILTNDENVFLVNNREEFSSMLRKLRQNLICLIPLFYLIIFIILITRYGLRKSLGIIVPPLASCLLTVAILSLFSIEITLMHILGLTLVLGVGIDYTIFLSESRDDFFVTSISIIMSALTTILSFGLLTISKTPALNAFGQTIITGIMLSVILCPLAANRDVFSGAVDEL